MAIGSITLDQLASETVWLRRLAGSLVADQGDDVVHDTLLVASAHAPADRPLRPWLYRTLLNRVRVVTRSGSRRKKREEAAGELATAPARPDEIVERIELHRRLAGYVLELPQSERDVVLLHYFEGLTSIAIGNRLGISAGTVRWRLKHAVDELRVRLDAESPNRAWLAPMLGLVKRSSTSVSISALVLAALAAIAIVLAIVAIPHAANDVAFTPSAGDDTAVPTERATAEVAPLATASGRRPQPYVPLEDRKLSGRVVDTTGNPVADAEVILRCSRDEPAPEMATHTGGDGAFAFDVDPECDYQITAAKDDTFAATGAFMQRALNGPIELRLARSATWVLRLVDAQTGAPIANAQATSRTLESFFMVRDHAMSDASGAVRIRWLDRVTWAEIEAPGYVPTGPQLRRDARPTADVEQTVRLERGVAVAGLVVDPEGRPIAGARAWVAESDHHAYRTRSDANGAFAVTVPKPGRYSLSADHPDFVESRGIELAVGPDGRSDVRLALAPGGEIAGTVLDLAGKPVAGAHVHTRMSERRPAVTDDRGHFEIHNITDDHLIAQRGHLATEWKHVTTAVGERAEVELQIGPSGIAGIVVDAKGNPVANAEVWLNYCCEAGPVVVDSKSTLTDDQGRFGIETPRGEFVLSVRRDRDDDFDDADDVRVHGGARDVRLVLP